MDCSADRPSRRRPIKSKQASIVCVERRRQGRGAAAHESNPRHAFLVCDPYHTPQTHGVVGAATVQQSGIIHAPTQIQAKPSTHTPHMYGRTYQSIHTVRTRDEVDADGQKHQRHLHPDPQLLHQLLRCVPPAVVLLQRQGQRWRRRRHGWWWWSVMWLSLADLLLPPPPRSNAPGRGATHPAAAGWGARVGWQPVHHV